MITHIEEYFPFNHSLLCRTTKFTVFSSMGGKRSIEISVPFNLTRDDPVIKEITNKIIGDWGIEHFTMVLTGEKTGIVIVNVPERVDNDG